MRIENKQYVYGTCLVTNSSINPPGMGTKTLVPTISCNSEKELKIKLKNKLAQHDQNGVHIYIFFLKIGKRVIQYSLPIHRNLCCCLSVTNWVGLIPKYVHKHSCLFMNYCYFNYKKLISFINARKNEYIYIYLYTYPESMGIE